MEVAGVNVKGSFATIDERRIKYKLLSDDERKFNMLMH